MKAYLHDEKTDGFVYRLCTEAGLETLTPEVIRERQAVELHFESYLDQVDVLIMEITHPTQDIHFILAQAILTDKPTLCLYSKNQAPRELLSYVRQKKSPRRVKTFSYTEKNLSFALSEFIQTYDPLLMHEDSIPSIKFTLRLTPRIERYLEWYAHQTGISKADLIRTLLDQEEKNNEAYQSTARR